MNPEEAAVLATVREFVVERYFRDAPLMIVGEGTNEIRRTAASRSCSSSTAPG